MAHQVFISYAIEDKPIADAVCKALEQGGVRCWYAPRDVPYAVDYEEAIVDAISASKLMLLVLSSHSNDSKHVKREVQNASREEPQVPVLPFQIEDVALNKSLKYYIGSVHWLSALTPPLEDHLAKLVDYVQQRLSRTDEDQPQDAGSDAQTLRNGDSTLVDTPMALPPTPSSPSKLSKIQAVVDKVFESLGSESVIAMTGLVLLILAGAVGFVAIVDGIKSGNIEQNSNAKASPTSTPKSDPTPALTAKEAFDRGSFALDNGSYNFAVDYFTLAVSLEPNNASYQNAVGLAEYFRNNYTKAEEWYRSALILEPGDAVILTNLGKAFHAQKNYAEAEKHLRQAVTNRPNDAGSHYELGSVFESQNKYKDAKTEYQKAVELEPGNGVYKKSLDALVRLMESVK